MPEEIASGGESPGEGGWREGVDTLAVVAGAALVALGALLVLDQAGALELDFGWLGAAMAAAGGVILLVSGLTNARR